MSNRLRILESIWYSKENIGLIWLKKSECWIYEYPCEDTRIHWY
jgi:hypothetical protein